MLRLLATPRWLSFTAVALLAIMGFGALSLWQWNRAEEKRQDNQIVTTNTTTAAVSVSEAADSPTEWRHVSMTGRFGAEQHLLRNRPLDGSQGFWVVSPLMLDGSATTDGSEAGEPVVWVARGWIPQRTAATRTVTAPPPPAGGVVVSGYLRQASTEAAIPSDTFPDGQIAAINSEELSTTAGFEDVPGLTDWYVQEDPAATAGSTTSASAQTSASAEILPLPLPEADDARNLSYAGQWLLFASIAVGGWFYFLRREAKETDKDELDLTGATSNVEDQPVAHR